jgi:deoxyribodipyrimidine photo-lyase
MSAALVWFRNDLRLDDNPAFDYAIQSGLPIICLYIHGAEKRPLGGASRWWLHHSLSKLNAHLESKGGSLVIEKGNPKEVLNNLIAKHHVKLVTWGRRYDAASIAEDTTIKKDLKDQGLEVHSFNTSLLFEPHHIKNKQGTPFQVFTPFWKHCQTLEEPRKPLLLPHSINFYSSLPSRQIFNTHLESLQLLPHRPDWSGGLQESWQPGEDGARLRLDTFLHNALENYQEERNRPDLEGTSKLSPHLHFGEISLNTIYHRTLEVMAGNPSTHHGGTHFLSELGWREFSTHLIHHFPHIENEPLKKEFERFPWEENSTLLKAWQKGLTGYPIVDAGMRELWHTGWMHNRVRMIAASLLIKGLFIHWKRGEEWFWDTLVDADIANNTASWQWVAGSGADAAPYFRIFNPVLQGQKFDPQGNYIKKWIPELEGIEPENLHTPWLSKKWANISGKYPAPIVDHGESRDKALKLYKLIRSDFA